MSLVKAIHKETVSKTLGRALTPHISQTDTVPLVALKQRYRGTQAPKRGAVTIDNVLDLEGQFEYEGPVTTVRAYFQKMIFTLWEDPESFTGKRPFGDSGWVYPIIEVVEEVTNLSETARRFSASTKTFSIKSSEPTAYSIIFSPLFLSVN